MSSPKLPSEIAPAITHDLTTEEHLRQLVGNALDHCQRIKDRKKVADDLKALTGLGITKRMLDDWSAPSKKTLRFPASLVKALCEVTGDDTLARFLIPDRLQGALFIGERILRCPRLLEEVQAELAKLTKVEHKKKR